MKARANQAIRKDCLMISFPASFHLSPGDGSADQIVRRAHGLVSASLEILRSSQRMKRKALTAFAVTWLFFAVILFLPCLTVEACAQSVSSSGGISDLLASRELVAEEARSIVKAIPFGPPSRLLGRELPTSMDLREELPPVGQQGDGLTMTCVTFATAYYQMSQLEKHFRHPSWDMRNPEHQFSVAFASALGGGGFADDVYKVLQNYGCVDTAEMPYHASGHDEWPSYKPSASQKDAAKPYRIGGYAALWNYGRDPKTFQLPFDNPIENAKAWLADGFVLSTFVGTSSPDWPDLGCTPPAVFYDPVDTKFIGGHGVAIVGYNDNINPTGDGPDHKGGFLMVNSWGPNWNGDMHGYLWVSYDYVKRFVPYCWIMVPGRSDTPVITGCSFADKGRLLTIRGRNFGAYRRSAEVRVGGNAGFESNAATVTWTNEQITVRYGADCPPSGPVVVYNWEGVPSKPFNSK